MTSITPADTHSINGTGQKGGDYMTRWQIKSAIRVMITLLQLIYYLL